MPALPYSGKASITKVVPVVGLEPTRLAATDFESHNGNTIEIMKFVKKTGLRNYSIEMW